MSAVPKKKLCWNCEGNVAKDIDNCPYCGVYLHTADIDENPTWNPSYRPLSQDEDFSSPFYQAKLEAEQEPQETPSQEKSDNNAILQTLLAHLKQDIFPILFLMTGSIFFLFGVVLLLFSQNGTLTLQWQESYSIYFLIFAIPLVSFGWILFQQLETDD